MEGVLGCVTALEWELRRHLGVPEPSSLPVALVGGVLCVIRAQPPELPCFSDVRAWDSQQQNRSPACPVGLHRGLQ
jgi:hypothetical protein